MKELSFDTNISKMYMMAMIVVTLLVLGAYYSYAIFTVSKERNNAISITTGNLIYVLQVDGENSNTLTVGSGEIKEFTITLSNPNNRVARFNFYYEGSIPSGVEVGYVTGSGFNTPPATTGVNLEKSGVAGSSNIYKIRVINNTNSSVIMTLGVNVGLDYNDLELPSNGHLFEESKLEVPLSDILLENVGANGSTYNDETDTFITGEDPNNYIWYSGKLWRAVSVNNEEKTTKLVTQWNMSAITYSSGSTDFDGSYMESWLNDTTVDGFLGNLRDYENFIVMDAKWNATQTDETTKPADTTIVEDPVGLLNIYEYAISYDGVSKEEGYLNNGLIWWTLTPYSSTRVFNVDNSSEEDYSHVDEEFGVRPSINLKSNVKVVDGNGTVDNPYRLEGDNDTDLSGTLLSNRYSGEYIRFGTGENNLYRIVSHETSGLTKITSASPLLVDGTYKTTLFDTNDNTLYSATNEIGSFLNNDYLDTTNGYLTANDKNMIEENTTWYLGAVDSDISYLFAKYKDESMNEYVTDTTISTVGLLRYGELMSGNFTRYNDSTTTNYWLITPYASSNVRYSYYSGIGHHQGVADEEIAIKPSFNLKSNVVITEGNGTRSNPFILELG